MIKKGEKSDVPFCYLTSLRQAVAVNNHYPTEDIGDLHEFGCLRNVANM